MISPELWGTEMRDVGYLHARAGAAQALLRLGQCEGARLSNREIAQQLFVTVEVLRLRSVSRRRARVQVTCRGHSPGQ